MAHIKEPLGIDFYVEPKALTIKEKETISKHIREYKAKIAKRENRRTNAVSKKKSLLVTK